MRVFPPAERTGVVQNEFNPPPVMNSVALTLDFVPPAGAVRLRVLVEQSEDGVAWFPLGGAEVVDVRNNAGPYIWTFSEQLMRSDVCDVKGYGSCRSFQSNGKTYRQLALMSRQRLTVETDAPLTYSVDADVSDNPPPQSAQALLGIGP